ncbi:MAG: VanW family protein [Abditibacteriota bacterium]|nr:VanW family protein [Abditibacteriota bacterium]
MNKTKKIVAAAAAVLVCLAVLLPWHMSLSVSRFASSGRLAPDAEVGGVAVGGMTREEAAEAVRSHVRTISSAPLSIKIGDSTFHKPCYELGLFWKWEPALDKAYALGRSGGLLAKYLAIKGGKLGKSFDIEQKIDKSVIDRYIREVNRSIDQKPRNAGLVFTGKGVSLVPAVIGKKIDEAAASEAICAALKAGASSVELEYVADYPRIKSEDLQSVDTRLGSFTTNYNAGKVARTHNLKTAAGAINGTILMPGETFSYNGIVGPRDTSTGYKTAIIFQDGEEVEGMGGGVCQVSSTLFNAVLLSGLKITSRRCHSLKVAYVPLGRDAMVSYGSSDFCFVNDTPDPVAVFASIGGGSLSMQLWGSSRSKKEVSVSTSVYNGGFGASLTRYVTAGGVKKADYTASSTYRRPKPKEPPAEKPKPAQPKPETPAPPAGGDGNGDLTLIDG